MDMHGNWAVIVAFRRSSDEGVTWDVMFQKINHPSLWREINNYLLPIFDPLIDGTRRGFLSVGKDEPQAKVFNVRSEVASSLSTIIKAALGIKDDVKVA